MTKENGGGDIYIYLGHIEQQLSPQRSVKSQMNKIYGEVLI